MYSNINIGLTTLIAYFFAFINYFWAYLFDMSSGSLYWDASSTGQIVLNGSIPDITSKGNDVVAAVITILHNGFVSLAEFSTLLPN
jgi:hypothetical protein